MRMVLLEHIQADGTSHFDWLIERERVQEGARAEGLITFRVGVRIDGADCEVFEAERAADHREVYLTFEGELTGGRGSVKRIAAGVADGVREGAGEIVVRGWIGTAAGVWEGKEWKEPEGRVRWRFNRGPLV